MAFTQMTKGAVVRHLSGMAKGLSGWQPACSLFVVIPAEAGIQEGAGGMLDELQHFPVRARRIELSFPLSGNGLLKPLDSGLRRNDGGLDSSFCLAATGFLGGLFQTCLRQAGAALPPTPL